MTHWISFRPAVALAMLTLGVVVIAAQPAPQELESLRERLAQRFDIVPLSDAVGLRPKSTMADVRLIEVGDTISINGVTVTGRELREKVGEDADAILRLSYLDAGARRAFSVPTPQGDTTSPPPQAGPAGEPPLATPPPDAADEPARRDLPRRRSGDRVRIFGDVHVTEGESLTGQAVAVMGSVRVDGEVDDQVVAVMGSVHLGPRAVVRGDIVSVGGRIHRAPGSQVRGDVTEVALGGGIPGSPRGWPVGVSPRFGVWDGFGGVPRLVGSAFRLLLLALLASVALLVARQPVEGAAQRVSDMPVHSTLVGVMAILLLGPVLFLISLLLVLTVVGLLLVPVLIPFLLVAALLMALAGFSGAAYTLGQWARRRLGMAAGSPFLDIVLGVFIVLLPLLLGRFIALAGWWSGPVSTLFIATGFGWEFLVWSAGFGAILVNAFGRWQARRAIQPVPPAAPAPNVGP
jgi:hypothetical protein